MAADKLPPLQVTWTPELFEKVRSWDFEGRGNSDLAWLTEAHTLSTVADLIPDRFPHSGELMSPERAVEAMLRGLAFECLFKARWLQIDAGNQFVRNGQFAGLRSHDLVWLAEQCGWQVNDEETVLLDRLAAFVTFAGRYPVPLKVEETIREEDGRPLSPRYFSVDDFAAAQNLFLRFWRLAVAHSPMTEAFLAWKPFRRPPVKGR